MATAMASVTRFIPLLFVFAFFSQNYQLTFAKSRLKNVPGALKITEDKHWSGLKNLGQVSGLAVDGDGNVHVFHRGERIWDHNTFDKNFQLKKKNNGPILNATVLVIDPETERVVYSWGGNRFYMPHGLTVDKRGNSWVTDVGLHQVMKFPARENVPSLILGEAFVPDSDKKHFCQPTDVAVTDSGTFFVSDGYCNSRIVMFSRYGKFIKEIGTADELTVPHSLAFVPKIGALCVADRENWRLVCYTTGTDGKPAGGELGKIEGDGIGRVFAIDRRDDELYALNGPDLWESKSSPAANYGVVIDFGNQRPTSMWGPNKGFAGPHDLAVSPDGRYVYVSEIHIDAPKKVYRFNIEG